MGRLCRDPQAYDPQEERTIYCDRDNDEAVDTIRSCQYQMAIGRNVRIEEDPEDKRADFPWIKSFGDQAKQDFKALRTSSGIYIRGSISTRTFKRHVVCQHCGREYDVQAMASEIVPYSVEYLTNCILPNGQEEEETYVVPSALVQPQT